MHTAERYADVPCADPDDLGYVQQIYVDDGALGGFGEMEYHGPAAVASAGGDAGDLSEVWAFCGTGLSGLAETILERFSTPLPLNP